MMKRKRLTERHKKRISQSLKGKKRKTQRSKTQKFSDISSGVNRLANAGVRISKAVDGRRYTLAKIDDLSDRRMSRNLRLIGDFL